LACKLDITAHLLSLGESSGQQRTGDENVNEVDLILNRAGYFVATKNEKMSMTICPRLQTGLAERATHTRIQVNSVSLIDEKSSAQRNRRNISAGINTD